MYNGDLYDDNNNGKNGFGTNVAAVGIDFFEGPYQDTDGIDNPGPVFDSLTRNGMFRMYQWLRPKKELYTKDWELVMEMV